MPKRCKMPATTAQNRISAKITYNRMPTLVECQTLIKTCFWIQQICSQNKLNTDKYLISYMFIKFKHKKIQIIGISGQQYLSLIKELKSGYKNNMYLTILKFFNYKEQYKIQSSNYKIEIIGKWILSTSSIPFIFISFLKNKSNGDDVHFMGSTSIFSKAQ